LKKLIVGPQFTPTRTDKLLLLTPGFDGGGEWGGPAVDPAAQVLFVNANNISWLTGLTLPPSSSSVGGTLYQSRCAMCHGADRAGQAPVFPSLLGIHDRIGDEQIEAQIRNGKGRMPAFPDLSQAEVKNLVHFLMAGEIKTDSVAHTNEMDAAPSTEEEIAIAKRVPYQFTGYKKFLDPDGYPAVAAPWGTLNAIDLKTGKYLWKIPFGEFPELLAKGIKDTGSDSYGGPVVTAGGVLFIAATPYDRKLRVFDSRSGKLLWETEMPYAGLATPTTYMVNGKQYIAVGAGGGKGTPDTQRGGVYVAYRLK
jgi:quinoprotein glucose dehydrogenase